VVATAVVTDSPQALPSTQQQGDLARQASLADIWETVGAILLGFIAISLLTLTAYYFWRRRRNAKLQLLAAAPSRKFAFTCLNVRREFASSYAHAQREIYSAMAFDSRLQL
jgi:LPXTG-motif cell wall-anchored protein